MTEHNNGTQSWLRRLDPSFLLAVVLQLVAIGVIYGMDYQKWQNQAQLNQQVATTLTGIQAELQSMHDEQIEHDYRIRALEPKK